MLPKAAIKAHGAIRAYERWNVACAHRAGLRGRAQIGKGMWPVTILQRTFLD